MKKRVTMSEFINFTPDEKTKYYNEFIDKNRYSLTWELVLFSAISKKDISMLNLCTGLIPFFLEKTTSGEKLDPAPKKSKVKKPVKRKTKHDTKGA